MPIQINIRDVPEKVRDEIAARAALQGKSMQEFMRAELERLVARPSIDAWLQQVRKRKGTMRTRLSAKQAWYVALAEVLHLPLATLDRPLSRSNAVTCKFLTPGF
jgi:antitoxin FitA